VPGATDIWAVLSPKLVVTARMVIRQADRPLLDRDIDPADAHLAVLVDALDLSLTAIDERARVPGVGQEVVHRDIGPIPEAGLCRPVVNDVLAAFRGRGSTGQGVRDGVHGEP